HPRTTNELFALLLMRCGTRLDFSPPSISMRMGVGLDCVGDALSTLPLVWVPSMEFEGPIAGESGTPVSDSGPILRHTSGPSSHHSVPLPDSWRVLKTRKDSDFHPPLLPGGGLPVCTGPS